jgi:transcriptional regulator GlxA family with amidase domain
VHDPAEPFAGAVAHTVLMAWAAATARKGKMSVSNVLRGKLLRDVLAYIRDELDEPISFAALAEHAGLTAAGFSKQFEEVTGLTPQAWQMEARVRNAQRLMIDEPKGSLDEFASLCGFADQSHFSRVFLKVVGQSPTEWLRRQT